MLSYQTVPEIDWVLYEVVKQESEEIKHLFCSNSLESLIASLPGNWIEVGINAYRLQITKNKYYLITEKKESFN